MEKTTFKIFVVLLCGFLLIGMASTNNERLQTAKKFKEIDRLANKLQDTHQIPMQDIMPRIKEAERHFKQREYQKAGQLLDGIIAELKRTPPLTPASDNFDTTKINTSGWQDTPFISADGKKLFFTYSPHDFLRAKKTKFKEIMIRGPIRPGHTREEYITRPQVLVAHNYLARLNADGTWSTPQPLHFDGGDSVGGSMWVSKDGNDMYLAGWGNPNRSNYGSGDIYVSSRKSKNNWSAPINLGPTINTKHLEDNPHFLEDRQTLYFDSDRPGGYGNWDIYYTVRNKDGSWSKPVNMGAPINTKATEGMAFLSGNGRELYFVRGDSSRQKPSQFFVSEKNADGNWDEPQLINFGMTSVSSPSLTEDGKALYFLWVDHQKKEITIWVSEKKPDGMWHTPKPVN